MVIYARKNGLPIATSALLIVGILISILEAIDKGTVIFPIVIICTFGPTLYYNVLVAKKYRVIVSDEILQIEGVFKNTEISFDQISRVGRDVRSGGYAIFLVLVGGKRIYLVNYLAEQDQLYEDLVSHVDVARKSR